MTQPTSTTNLELTRAEAAASPTVQDPGRDLLADLALCEAATPGPWHRDVPAWAGLWDVGVVLSSWSEEPRIEVVASCNARQGTTEDAPGAAAIDERQATANARMIAASRQGWPAAIQIALALRAENAQLRQDLEASQRTVRSLADRAAGQSELLSRWAEVSPSG